MNYQELYNELKSQTAEKDTRISELEEELQDKTDSPGWNSYNHAVTETGEANLLIEEKDARIKELEDELTAFKEWRNSQDELFKSQNNNWKKCIEELEAVKALLDGFKSVIVDELPDIISAAKSSYYVTGDTFESIEKVEEALSRLSSGETNPGNWYCADKYRVGCVCEEQCNACEKADKCPEPSADINPSNNSSSEQEIPWISVEDRLPKEGGRFLVWVEQVNDLGIECFFWNCAYHPGQGFTDKGKMYRVTHYQYIEPPKAEQ